MRAKLRLGVVLLALLAVGLPSAAQVQTGSILVRAVDQQGAVLPGTTVTIASPNLVAGQMTATTDSTGVYRFPSLPPGTYTITVELQGFKTIIREDIAVQAGQSTPLELRMEVATVAEVITVRGETPVIDTTSANVNVHLDSKLLDTTPAGRDIWSIVEYKVPGLVMSSPDVGGNQGGLQRGIESRGTPNSQNVQYLNGVNVGDPAAIGYAGYYYDPSSFEDIQVSSGAQDISVPSGGVFINMVTKSGSNAFNGNGVFTYQGHNTQSDNIDAALQHDGIRPEANAVDFITNANFNLGGPILKNRLFFFGAVNDQRTHVNVVGFPAAGDFGNVSENTDITSGFIRGTYQLNASNRFDVTASRQLYDKPNRGASAFNTPDSTWHERDILAVYQGLWNLILNDRMFVDSRISYNSIDFPLFLKTEEQSIQDLTTSIRTRANAQERLFVRERLQVSSQWQYYVPELWGGRHELRAGIDNAYTPDSDTTTRNGDVLLRYRSEPSGSTPAGPVDVTIYNTPTVQKRAVNMTAIYAQDTFSYKRLSVVGGIRWERVEGWIPPQSNPPSQYYPEGTVISTIVGGEPIDYVVRRSFDELRGIPLWKNVGPRVSAIYDLNGDGRTAIKASGARYYETIGTGTPGSLSPNGSVNQRYVWNDLNGDFVYQPGEEGRLLRTSVPATEETLALTRDPNIRRPYRTEWTIGVDHQLRPNMRVSVTWIQQREHDPITDVELNVPFDAYTPVRVVEQGRDGVFGTADDQTITVYDENLPLQTHITQQRNDNRVAERYKGLELTFNKRYSDGWTLLAGYTWARTEADMLGVTTPNEALVNAAGRSGGREHIFKMTGSYLLPWDILVGGNFRLESGRFITRTVDIPGLTQGTVTVNAEPRGNATLDKLPTIDLRAGKIFRFRDGQQIEVDVDLYNITNANTVYNVRSDTGTISVREAGDPNGQLNTIPRFLAPTGVLGPRILRFNVVYRFGLR